MFDVAVILFAFLALSAVSPIVTHALPIEQAPQFHELTTRSLLAKLDKRDQPILAPNAARIKDLPIVTLPYGQYRASKYVRETDIYVFKNVRFGAPPIGALRFAPPQAPLLEATISDGSYGPQCIQTLAISNIANLDLAGILSFGNGPSLITPEQITPLLDELKPIILELDREGALDKIINIVRPLLGPGGPLAAFPGTIGDLIEALSGVLGLGQSEDCLFLDVYVPGKVIRKEMDAPLPVMHWIYGGGYIFGTKDGLYDGFGVLKASNNEMIFVASNYRMGAFGFLAGRTAEQANATNIALFDQRAALQWTQDYISLFGGDKTRVTAAGESAGAGSLMHHITAFGGKQSPLFRQAILQSPAFQPILDRDGLADKVFRSFEAEAGCAGQGFACLSAISTRRFQRANERVIRSAPPGTFSFGVAADGKWVRQVPSLELYSGNYFKDLDSVIVTHTGNEPYMFSDPKINTPKKFDRFQRELLPNDIELQSFLQQHYTQFPDARSRLLDLVQGSSFGCNARYLAQAFPAKTYLAQYSKARGSHGSDILPTFYSKQSPLAALVGVINPAIPIIGREMQGFFSAFVTTGDPNKASRGSSLPSKSTDNSDLEEKPFVDSTGVHQEAALAGLIGPKRYMPKIADVMAESLAPVLSFDDRSSLISDETTTASQCNFWKEAEIAATNFLGYAAPGTQLMSSLLSVADPSRFFNSPRPQQAPGLAA